MNDVDDVDDNAINLFAYVSKGNNCDGPKRRRQLEYNRVHYSAAIKKNTAAAIVAE